MPKEDFYADKRAQTPYMSIRWVRGGDTVYIDDDPMTRAETERLVTVLRKALRQTGA